jgi:hypothetical protein
MACGSGILAGAGGGADGRGKNRGFGRVCFALLHGKVKMWIFNSYLGESGECAILCSTFTVNKNYLNRRRIKGELSLGDLNYAVQISISYLLFLNSRLPCMWNG